jgi:hypothetical protein
MTDRIDLDQYYTAKEAAEELSRRSGKRIDAAYMRNLARYGKLHPKRINSRLNLYPKYEIDNYIVEGRGAKAAEAAKAKATKRVKKQEKAEEPELVG